MNSLPEKLRAAIGQHPAIFGHIFGSYSKGSASQLSDLDVAVYFDPQLSKYARHRARMNLITLCQEVIPDTRVDLVVLNDVPPILGFEIIKYGKMIFDLDPTVRQSVEERMIMNYLDFKPFSDKFNFWQTETILESKASD